MALGCGKVSRRRSGGGRSSAGKTCTRRKGSTFSMSKRWAADSERRGSHWIPRGRILICRRSNSSHGPTAWARSRLSSGELTGAQGAFEYFHRRKSEAPALARPTGSRSSSEFHRTHVSFRLARLPNVPCKYPHSTRRCCDFSPHSQTQSSVHFRSVRWFKPSNRPQNATSRRYVRVWLI